MAEILDGSGKIVTSDQQTPPRIVKIDKVPAKVSRQKLSEYAKTLSPETEMFFVGAQNVTSENGAVVLMPPRIEILNPPAEMTDEALSSWVETLPVPERSDEEELEVARNQEWARKKAELETILSTSNALSGIRSGAEVEAELRPRLEALETSRKALTDAIAQNAQGLNLGTAARNTLEQKFDKALETLATTIGGIDRRLSTIEQTLKPKEVK